MTSANLMTSADPRMAVNGKRESKDITNSAHGSTSSDVKRESEDIVNSAHGGTVRYNLATCIYYTEHVCLVVYYLLYIYVYTNNYYAIVILDACPNWRIALLSRLLS